MERLDTLRELMAASFGIDGGSITAATVQDDVAEWDSVTHLNLMLSLEEAFGLELSITEMGQLRSVQAILDLLEAKCRSS
jgi:acyl carrier protein